ncbi:uncharacterized protein [Equus asinus]|uniref:uncharacterized protein n=1 Tax=Equus asinus TaxID=9793 RepID=UPI001D041756|nr:uncharacterized protein LOC106842004 [Equus asinus]
MSRGGGRDEGREVTWGARRGREVAVGAAVTQAWVAGGAARWPVSLGRGRLAAGRARVFRVPGSRLCRRLRGAGQRPGPDAPARRARTQSPGRRREARRTLGAGAPGQPGELGLGAGSARRAGAPGCSRGLAPAGRQRARPVLPCARGRFEGGTRRTRTTSPPGPADGEFRSQLVPDPRLPRFRNAFVFSCSENFRETFQVLLRKSAAPRGASWHLLQLSLNYRRNFNFTIIRRVNCSSSRRNEWNFNGQLLRLQPRIITLPAGAGRGSSGHLGGGKLRARAYCVLRNLPKVMKTVSHILLQRLWFRWVFDPSQIHRCA